MTSSEILRKPTLAVVIAFCDSTPYDPIPRPHVIAQAAGETGQHELWNMAIPPEMSSLEVFEAFAATYLHRPSDASKISFMPLARLETDTHELRVFAASRLFRWQDFRQLDDKELVPLTRARKQPHWTKTTRTAVENAYRSQGMKLILNHARMVRQSQIGSLNTHRQT